MTSKTTLEDVALGCNGILNALYDRDQGVHIAKLLFEQLQTDIANNTALMESHTPIKFIDIHKKPGSAPFLFTLSELLEYVAAHIQTEEKPQKNAAQISNPSFSALSTIRKKDNNE